MKGKFLTKQQIAAFTAYLESEEKSKNTIEKYVRDVGTFAAYVKNCEITKETVIAYKKGLQENYAVRSVNSMLASINSLFAFLSWHELKVKSVYAFPDKNAKRKCEAIASIHIKDDIYKNRDINKVCEILVGAELSYKNTIELYYSAQF